MKRDDRRRGPEEELDAEQEEYLMRRSSEGTRKSGSGEAVVGNSTTKEASKEKKKAKPFKPVDKYEDLPNASESIFRLDTQEAFDGVKCDLTRNLGSNFQISHGLSLGSQEEPPSYHLSSVYIGPTYLLTSRLYHDGRLMGRFRFALPSLRLDSTLQLTAGNQKSPFVAQVEVNQQFPHATVTAQYAEQQQEKSVGVAVAAGNKELVVGSNFTYSIGKTWALSLCGRILSGGTSLFVQTFGTSSLQISVTRKVGKHTLASQFGFMWGKKEKEEADQEEAPESMEPKPSPSFFRRYGLQSVAQVGFSTELPTGFLRCTIDSTGRFNALYDDNNIANLSIFGSYNCLEGTTRTGINMGFSF